MRYLPENIALVKGQIEYLPADYQTRYRSTLWVK
jgi:hypothetical protein